MGTGTLLAVLMVQERPSNKKFHVEHLSKFASFLGVTKVILIEQTVLIILIACIYDDDETCPF